MVHMKSILNNIFMKNNTIFSVGIILFSLSCLHAAPLSDELVVLHNATTTEMNTISSPAQGSLIFNTDDNEVYERNATSWKRISADGSETKILGGSCMDITGIGTSNNPYTINQHYEGKTQETAGLTCKQILDTNCTKGDGFYWINPDGGSTDNAFQVYCDMTTDGGGWTRIDYGTDLVHKSHFSGGDASKWLPDNFSLVLSDAKIDAIRAVSTEGKQIYRGTCDGVIHYRYKTSNYNYAFGFRFHNGDETVSGQQNYIGTSITVPVDGCAENNNYSTGTVFEINDKRVPIINIKSKDNGNNNEMFGSPLTLNPAWLR